ncbi:MAG: hypothetical protein JSR09_05900 [Bacteroidetes bacterium]|nr:hypothetical protein [Bacteroidota bacterium]
MKHFKLMNYFLFLSLLTVASFAGQSQSITWVTVKIDGLGSIGLPSNMEIQGGAYKQISEKIKEVNGASASKVIFQQKNLNNFDGNSFQTYARVFLRTETASAGDFKKLSEPLTQTEANEVNQQFKESIYSEATRANATILEWNSAKVSNLNGHNAIKFGYKRQIGSNKPVLVEIYLIQNNDRLHTITFEYRLDDNNWSSTFASIKSTIKIPTK